MRTINDHPWYWGSWMENEYWEAFGKKFTRRIWHNKQRRTTTLVEQIIMPLTKKKKWPVSAGKIFNRMERLERRHKRHRYGQDSDVWSLVGKATEKRREEAALSGKTMPMMRLVRTRARMEELGSGCVSVTIKCWTPRTRPLKRRWLRFCRRAKRKNATRQWRRRNVGLESAFKKASRALGQRKSVRWSETVEVKEFWEEQKTATTLTILSTTAELKQKPLAFFDGRADAWTRHASSQFSDDAERDTPQVAVEAPVEERRSLLDQLGDLEQLESGGAEDLAGDVASALSQLVAAGLVEGRVCHVHDADSDSVREVVVLEHERDYDRVLQYCRRAAERDAGGWSARLGV